MNKSYGNLSEDYVKHIRDDEEEDYLESINACGKRVYDIKGKENMIVKKDKKRSIDLYMYQRS